MIYIFFGQYFKYLDSTSQLINSILSLLSPRLCLFKFFSPSLSVTMLSVLWFPEALIKALR